MRFPFCCDIYVESLKTLTTAEVIFKAYLQLCQIVICCLIICIRYSKVGTLVIAFYLTFTTILVWLFWLRGFAVLYTVTTVSLLLRTLTLRYRWYCWAWLCGIIDTAELDSAVSLIPLSLTLGETLKSGSLQRQTIQLKNFISISRKLRGTKIPQSLSLNLGVKVDGKFVFSFKGCLPVFIEIVLVQDTHCIHNDPAASQDHCELCRFRTWVGCSLNTHPSCVLLQQNAYRYYSTKFALNIVTSLNLKKLIRTISQTSVDITILRQLYLKILRGKIFTLICTWF